jgi:hypothetical protein
VPTELVEKPFQMWPCGNLISRWLTAFRWTVGKWVIYSRCVGWILMLVVPNMEVPCPVSWLASYRILCFVEVSEEEISCIRRDLLNLDRFLGPYPFDIWKRWKDLTSKVTGMCNMFNTM